MTTNTLNLFSSSISLSLHEVKKIKTTPNRTGPSQKGKKMLLMSNHTISVLLLVSACLYLLHSFNGVSALGFKSLKTDEIDVMVKRVCAKKIEDCLNESEMVSETSKRVLLEQKRYISYDTLHRDMVPCAKPGASYYACHQQQVNPYGRGCEVITRCARDTKS